MTRGDTRSIQFSSRFDRGIKLHRTVMISRDRRRCQEAFRPDDSHRRALDHPDLLPLWRSAEPSRPLDLHRTASGGFASRSRRTGSDQSRWSIQLEHNRTAVEHRGRTPRSRRDRAEIEEILARDRRGFISHRSASDQRSSSIAIDARSRPNCGAMVAKIAAKIGISLRPN